MPEYDSIASRLETLAKKLERREITIEEFDKEKSIILGISQKSSLIEPARRSEQIEPPDDSIPTSHQHLNQPTEYDESELFDVENKLGKYQRGNHKDENDLIQEGSINSDGTKYPPQISVVNKNSSYSIGIISGLTILSILIIIGIANNITYQNNAYKFTSAAIRREVEDLRTYLPLPRNKGLYKKPTGEVAIYRYTTFRRINPNNDHVYDVNWSDGVKSSYVFWTDGIVEIFSKNGYGGTNRTQANYEVGPNGNCVIRVNTGSVTLFPSFKPIQNNHLARSSRTAK